MLITGLHRVLDGKASSILASLFICPVTYNVVFHFSIHGWPHLIVYEQSYSTVSALVCNGFVLVKLIRLAMRC
uniref:Uncharacterized protein n=1 Tax=Aegilops tauschii subsp. strangulata TaxID=200361 RepID=A0A453HNK0_AEGTS